MSEFKRAYRRKSEYRYLREHYLTDTDEAMAPVVGWPTIEVHLWRVRKEREVAWAAARVAAEQDKPQIPYRYKGTPIDNGITPELKARVERMKMQEG